MGIFANKTFFMCEEIILFSIEDRMFFLNLLSSSNCFNFYSKKFEFKKKFCLHLKFDITSKIAHLFSSVLKPYIYFLMLHDECCLFILKHCVEKCSFILLKKNQSLFTKLQCATVWSLLN